MNTPNDNQSLSDLKKKLHTTEILPDGSSKVISFDYQELQKHFKGNFKDLGAELFKVGEKWKDRSTLRKAVTSFAAKAGFAVSFDKDYLINCNRAGETKKKKSTTNNILQDNAVANRCSSHQGRNYDRLKINCKFSIQFTHTVSVMKAPARATAKSKTKKRPVWDDGAMVVITKANHEHTNGCVPCGAQLQMARDRSGQYHKNINKSAWFSLCYWMKHNGRVSNAEIKNALKPVCGPNKVITANDIYSVRRTVMRLLPLMDEKPDYQDFVNSINTNDLCVGADSEDLCDDEAIKFAIDIWLQILNDGDRASYFDNVGAFGEYLELIKQKAKGFSYRLQRDPVTNKIISAAWQTATMRDNFERFGGYISLDAMKRDINKLLWPYSAVCMYNDLNMVCVGCESILSEESKESYKFLIDFMCDSAPGRKREDINVVAGDGFFSQTMITEYFCLTSAKFILDHYHLFKGILKERFGLKYNLLKDDLKLMANSRTADGFNTGLSRAKQKLIDSVNNTIDSATMEELENFANEKNTYALHCINQIKGSRGMRGSQSSEANHSSVIVYLNDGSKGPNNYTESPSTLIRDLFSRQRFHIQKWNSVLALEKRRLETEHIRLQKEPETENNKILLDAVKVLNLKTYQSFKMAHSKVIKGVFKVQYDLNDDGTKTYQVSDSEYPNQTPRVFSDNERCNCTNACAHEQQCEHELAAFGKFCPNLFQKRHMRRDKVQGSLTGWSPPTDDHFEDIDGCYFIDTDGDDGGADVNENNQVSVQSSIPGGNSQNLQNELHSTALPCTTRPPSTQHHNENDSNQEFDYEVQPLSKNELDSILKKILLNYNSCSSDTKFLIGTLVNEVSEICTTNNSSNSAQRNTHQNHSTTRIPRNDITVPAPCIIRGQPKRRLMGASERNSRNQRQKRTHFDTLTNNDVQPNRKSSHTCSFCKQSGHNKSNCPTKRRYENIGKTYDLSDTAVVSDIRRRIENDMPLNAEPSDQRCAISLSDTQLKSHLLLHEIYPKIQLNHQALGYLQLNSLNFKVSFISMSDGKIIDSHSNILISGTCMEKYLDKHAAKCFLFDGTDESRCGSKPSWIKRSKGFDFSSQSIPSLSVGSYSAPNMNFAQLRAVNNFPMRVHIPGLSRMDNFNLQQRTATQTSQLSQTSFFSRDEIVNNDKSMTDDDGSSNMANL